MNEQKQGVAGPELSQAQPDEDAVRGLAPPVHERDFDTEAEPPPSSLIQADDDSASAIPVYTPAHRDGS